MIATRRGSMPEVVAHQETGFVVDDLGQAVTAVGRLDEIDRSACRRRVETRLSGQRMVEGYQAVYRRLLA